MMIESKLNITCISMICCLTVPHHLLPPSPPPILTSLEILLWKSLGFHRSCLTCLDLPFSHCPLCLNLVPAIPSHQTAAQALPGRLSRSFSSPNPTPSLNKMCFCLTPFAHYVHIVIALSTFHHDNILIYLSPNYTAALWKAYQLNLSF